MKQDEGWIGIEAWQRVAGRQRKPEGLVDRRAKSFGQLQISLHRVGTAINLREAMIKEPRPLTAIAHPPKLPRAAHTPDQCASEQALEVEGDIGSQPFRFFPPGQ